MYEGILQQLIDEFGRLPGIGPKSAQRIAFHIVQTEAYDPSVLAEILRTVRGSVKFCQTCGNISQMDECSICSDPRRRTDMICVVEEAKDIVAMEKTREFKGKYHVLGGAISPIDGIGPEQLRIAGLLERLRDPAVTEVILAMDPNVEGEATATYLSRLIGPLGIIVSRLASGLPVGGDLEYADEITLGRAFEGRTKINFGE